MIKKEPDLLLQSTPMLRQGMTTPRAMLDVFVALIPVTLATIWFFGNGALLLLATIAGALLTEWVLTAKERRREVLKRNIRKIKALFAKVHWY